jgi:membrane-bound serine protease (ClpP class)
VTFGISAILIFLVQLAVRAQRTPSVTGPAGMLHEMGQALTSIEPGTMGRVQTHGEIWSATSDEPIAAGQQVRVMGVSGLVLTVRPERGPVAATR